MKLLEREAELATIRQLAAAAQGGQGAVLAVEGRAGIGKTRLLAEARTLGAGAGLDVLAGRGSELEQEFSYGVVRQLFEPRIRLAAPTVRAELLDGAAGLAAPLFDDRAPTSGDASFTTLHGLFWLCANMALQRPLLLAVDDLQWCDAPTLRWLAYLAGRVEDLPVLVAVALRPPETDAGLVDALLAEPVVALLRPAALSGEAVAALIGPDGDPGFARTCHEATGGNPLLLDALLRSLAEEGVPPRAEQTARVREIGPEAVSRSVRLRLARLPAEAAALARAVAVLDEGARLEDAGALARLEPAAAVDAAAALARADILGSGPALGFVQPVVGRAIYAELSPREREEAHAHAADVLLAHAPPEQVAAHLLLTGPAGRASAVRVLSEAAERSLARGDPEGACVYLGRALAEPPPDDLRGGVVLALGEAERLVDNPAAAGHLREALDLGSDPAVRGAIALDLGRTLFFGNRPAEAVDVLEAAIGALGDEDTDLARRLEGGLLTVTALFPELYPLARRQRKRIGRLTIGDDVGSRTLLAATAYDDARAIVPIDECMERAGRALRGGRLWAEDNAAFTFATVALTVGDRCTEVAAVYEDAFADARLRGSRSAYAVTATFSGYLRIFTGELARAEEELSAALDASLRYGLAAGIPYTVAFLADVLMERGDLHGAQRTLDVLDGRGDTAHHFWFFLDDRARLRLLQGRPREALVDLAAGSASFEAVGGRNPALMAWRSAAALARRELGEHEEARRLAAEEVALAREWGASRALGAALRVAGIVGDDAAPLREAVAVLEHSPAVLERARALVDLGAAIRLDEPAEARNLLRQGLEIAHRCGAKLLQDQAQSELVAAGARPRRLVVTGVDALTPSERRVADLAVRGLTNRDIAQTLFVTPKTVELHLSAVYRKLGISGRGQLVGALGVPA